MPHDRVTIVEIPALAISSTDCRARTARGEPVWYLVPDGVVQYITKHRLYLSDRPSAPEALGPAGARSARSHRPHHPAGSLVTATDHALELVRAAAQAASDKLAEDVIAFDVSDQLVITDAFVLASASNDRQVKAIVDAVEDALRELGAKPVRREGERDGRWVLIDYAEIVVHVQHEEERAFYALERLWRDCPLIELPESVTSSASRQQLTRGARMSQQPSKRLFLLRHGRTEWNHTRRAQGQADVPLDEVGHAQAQAAAPRLALVGAVRLWSSDLARARQTADHVAAATGLKIEEDPRLREYSVGAREGMTWDEAVAEFPQMADGISLGERLAGVPGAETDDDVRDRIVPAVEDCLAALALGRDRDRGLPRGRAEDRAGRSAGLGRAGGALARRPGQLPLGDRHGAGGGAAATAARLRGGRFRIRDHHWLRFPGCLEPGGRPPGIEAAGLWRSW